MKVTPDNNAALNANRKIDKQPAKNNLDSAPVGELGTDALSQKSDFADVLDRVTRSHKEPARDSDTADRSLETRKNKVRDEDKTENNAETAVVDRPLTRESVRTENVTDARTILPTPDLEKIVAACRVQLAANGQQSVTIQLSQSVLEGLRVRVSADAAGRITADFLAASEQIKSTIDARSAELIAMLRSRGINLAEFKSSVATDAGGGSDSRREQQSGGVEEVGRGHKAAAAGAAPDATNEGEAPSDGATYRA
jgi:Flagellar hook-length control protein FliK